MVTSEHSFLTINILPENVLISKFVYSNHKQHFVIDFHHQCRYLQLILVADWSTLQRVARVVWSPASYLCSVVGGLFSDVTLNQCCGSGQFFSDPDPQILFTKYGSGSG